MIRTALLALAAFVTAPAFAGQPGADSQPAGALSAASPATSTVTFPAAADKVYPPLPSLAMLPPSSAGDDEPPLKPAPRRKKSRAPVQPQEHRSAPAPVVRLVVSDASHAYLDSVQRQIDLALAK
jgi:hypothetical protein